MAKPLTTTRLMQLLKNAPSGDVLLETADSITNPTLLEYMDELLKHSGKTITELANETLLDRSFVYQMFNGIRTPNRNNLLRFAFALHLTIEEAQRLLKLAHRGELYPRIRFDAAIIFCLHHKYTLYQTNEFLEKTGEEPLFYLEK